MVEGRLNVLNITLTFRSKHIIINYNGRSLLWKKAYTDLK